MGGGRKQFTQSASKWGHLSLRAALGVPTLLGGGAERQKKEGGYDSTERKNNTQGRGKQVIAHVRSLAAERWKKVEGEKIGHGSKGG